MDNNYKITIKGESRPIKTGDTFNRLTITEFTRHNGKLSANCICTCGNHVENVLVRHLLTGNTKSCGCYNSEIVKKRNHKHGYATRNKNRLYTIWQDMIRRCSNPSRKGHEHYYDKNITVCDEWKQFIKFKNWALSNGYNDTLTLERCDNNQGYNPSNCKWIPKSEQSMNRSTNHYITYNGETHTLTDWANKLGLSRSTLSNRLNTAKWSIEKAFTTPVPSTQTDTGHK